METFYSIVSIYYVYIDKPGQSMAKGELIDDNFNLIEFKLDDTVCITSNLLIQ